MTSRLAVSIGCPSGIGPEVSIAAASVLAKSTRQKTGRDVSVLLIGDFEVIARAARGRKIPMTRVERTDSPRFERGRILVWQPTQTLAARDRELGRASRHGGAAQLAWIDAACDLTSSGNADALVTGPVSKDSIASSNAPHARQFLGHTEHLQRRLHAREVVMCFATNALATALVTTHIPLAKVPRAITARAVARAAYWLAVFIGQVSRGALQSGKASRFRSSRIVVAGLNPHAGERGRIGKEEARIAKGIALAQERLAQERLARQRLGRSRVERAARVELVGPMAAESAFRLAAAGAYRGVVAMYHDQATIPMKLIGFGDAVNVTLGLPIVRTSVDHGTGYDRAARFDADARGMVAAMELGARLSRLG